MVRLSVFLIVVALAAMPAVATAAGTSTGFGTVPTQQVPEPTPAPAPEPTQPADNGVSGSQLMLMALGAVALLAGIWVVIMRDARRRVPERKRQRVAGDEPRTPGARTRRRKPSPAERRRRKRARAR